MVHFSHSNEILRYCHLLYTSFSADYENHPAIRICITYVVKQGRVEGLKMEAARSCETLEHNQKSTWHMKPVARNKFRAVRADQTPACHQTSRLFCSSGDVHVDEKGEDYAGRIASTL